MATPQLTQENLLSLLAAPKIVKQCRNAGIDHLRLFGSYARGDFSSKSDVDLLYTYNPSLRTDDRGVWGLYDIFEETLGKKVELVPKDLLRPEIKDTVFTSMIPVY